MSSDSEDEDFTKYGTALDPLDEDAFPRKKPFSLKDQVATDKYGRRRFHGAFTGGFSAGFFNSVGSLEGWTPSTFKSSRSDKARNMPQKPEDFMDEEDMDEFGIAPKVLRATNDFNEGGKKRARSLQLSSGPIPGQPVLRDLLQPSRETVGMKLLRKLGWKPGQGTGPRVTKAEKKKMKEEHKKTEAKMYGCALPQDFSRENESGEDSQSSTDDENDAELSFAPDDLQPFLCKPKDNYFGLGYCGLDRKPVLSSHIDLFTTPLRMEEKEKKVLIAGQAFGVGAFEDDDEDIYSQENMLQYDFTLGTEPAMSKQKEQIITDSSANYAACSLIGFILGTNAMTQKKHFPPPVLPHGFKPVHVARKSRFQPAPTEGASLNNKELHKSRRKGLQHHNLTATDRAQIISELSQKSTAQKDNIRSTTQQENKVLSDEELKTQKLEVSTKEGCIQFRPFAAHPEKQKRYEQYLTLCKEGQKDRLSYMQPLTMTEWEKERERVEFEQAARLYQPLSGIMSDRFVSASQPEDMNSPIPSVSKADDSDCEKKAAAKLKMFGHLTREESDWRPCSLLCKRFNIPELCPGTAESSIATQKTTSHFSVFNFLDASSYNNAVKPPANSVFNEMPSVSQLPEATLRQDTEAEEHEAESNTCNEVSSEQKCEDSVLEFPDPPAKIDLFKAIFLSSSEDSDSDSNENNSVNLMKESKSEEITLSYTNKTKSLLLESAPQVETRGEEDVVSSNNTLTPVEKNAQRNMSPPRGVFANLDLDAINARNKDKSNTVPENKLQPDISKSKQTIGDPVECEQNSRLEQIQENMYGPQLPSVSSSVSKNITVVHTVSKVLPSIAVAPVQTEWVEKTNKHSHKNKHKKHKKPSKHKKHKHKKRRH